MLELTQTYFNTIIKSTKIFWRVVTFIAVFNWVYLYGNDSDVTEYLFSLSMFIVYFKLIDWVISLYEDM